MPNRRVILDDRSDIRVVLIDATISGAHGRSEAGALRAGRFTCSSWVSGKRLCRRKLPQRARSLPKPFDLHRMLRRDSQSRLKAFGGFDQLRGFSQRLSKLLSIREAFRANGRTILALNGLPETSRCPACRPALVNATAGNDDLDPRVGRSNVAGQRKPLVPPGISTSRG